MQKFLFLPFMVLSILLMSVHSSKAGCYSGSSSYCTNISANNVSNWQMGIRNVTLNTTAIPVQINNSTAGGAGSPIYFDYTSQIIVAASGGSVNYAIQGSTAYPTYIRLFIDLNLDGTFATSSPEMILSVPSVPASGAGNILSGSFVLPTLSAGIYRIRVASDYDNNVPPPCGPMQYSAEVEDYTLFIPSASMDATIGGFTSPGFFATGNNTIGISFFNPSNTTITTADIGYQLDANAPVVQSLTGLSIAPGTTYTVNFATQLNIPATGAYSLKGWVTNPNGTGSTTPANDTTCRSFSVYCAGPLSGTYTIGGSPGPTNFANFNIADSNLITCGVSGPVVFNVSPGTYTGAIDLPAITGASATNTITFNGGSSATTIITATTTIGAPAVVRLNGCSYVTFKNFTIRTTDATNGWPVHLYNGVNNKINNCIIDIAGAGATSTSGNLAGVVINGSYTSIAASSSTGNGHIIDSCTFNAGYYNIYTTCGVGSNTYSFLYNTLNNAYQYGGYFNNSHTIKFNNNVINLRTSITSNRGLTYFNCNASGTHEIRNNKFNNIGIYGIEKFTSSGGAGSGQIYNNFFGGFRQTTGCAGIYNQGSANWKVWHNTININVNGTSGNSDCIYLNGGSGFDIKNNHLTITATSCVNANPMRFSSTGCASAVDYNNYFNASNTTLAAIPTVLTAGTYLAAYSTGAGANSMSINPGYINNNTNLHVANPCLNGTNLGLTTDIDSQARTSSPDIGADEVPSFSDDVMVMAVRSPATSVVTAGSPYTIIVTVRNAGSSTIADLDVNYSVNGVVTSQSFTGLSIAACDTAQLTFASTATFAAGNNLFRAFTGNLNFGLDLNNSNDTLTTTFCSQFSGVFSIDQTQPVSQTNFTSIQSAINAVYSCGVSGPVTFRIKSGSGPYNEQVLFNGIVPGSSAINNIRLSGNTTREVVTFSPTTSNQQHVIRMQATKHIIIDSMTINNTGSSFGIGVHITATSDSNYVQNSNVNISLASTSFGNSAGIAISSNAASATGAGNNGNKNIINNNAINGGYYGITTVGTNTSTFCLRNELTNNILNGQAYYGIYFYYQNFAKVNGNTVDNMLASNTNSYGMTFLNIDNFQINKNKINRFGQYGMNFQGVNHQGGSGTNRAQIFNNMIGGITYAPNPYGIYFNISSGLNSYRYVDFWHNTIHINNLGGGYTHYFQNTSGAAQLNSVDYRNNTFTCSGNTNYMAYFYNSAGAPFTNFLNNNIASLTNPTGPTVTMTTSSYSSTSWIPTGGSQSTSTCFGVNPQFLNNNTNLHSISTPLNDKGTNTTTALVPTDIDGDSRPLSPATTVDIGADEFNPPANNAGSFAVINPTAPLVTGLQNVVVQIKNYGTATLTSANVRYKVGINGAIKTLAWTGSVVNGGTANATFTGANQYNFTGSFDTIYTWTDAPNGQPDGYLLDDSIYSITCSPLNGTYTIDTTAPFSGSNFPSINAALASLINCGVTGPVTINVVQPGTYVGAIDMLPIVGASATNTITFNGVNNTNRILVASTSSTAPAVLRFNNCNYITFRNFTIRTLDANNGWCAHFMNGTNNRVNNCILDIGGAGASSGSSNLAPVVINGSLISMGTNSTIANNHRVDSSALNAGYYGIYTSVSANTNTFYYLNNTMNNAYQYGAYFQSAHVVKFKNNIVNMRGINTNTAGLYMQSVNPSGVLFSEINGNKFTNIGNYGIYMSSTSGSGSVQGQMYNNMISGFVYTSGNVGIYMNSSSRWNVWHNSINLNFASLGGQNNCIFVQNGSTNDVRNNIFSITSPTIVSAVPVYVSPTSAINNLNNNIYYNLSSSNIIAGAISSTATNYRVAYPLGGGAGSMNLDPRFVNNSTDLHTLNGCNTGANLGVTVDFDNQSRGTTPDIGADETSPVLNNDMGVLSLNTPSWPFLMGSTNVNVTLKNYGANTINSVTVSYTVNGGSLTTQTLTGLSLAPCDTMNFTFTTPYTVTGSSNFKVFTSNPNGSTDTYFLNDTVNTSLCIAMAGVYTIGGGGSFTTFTQAVAELNCAGVSGPVTFNVLSGTFTEQFSIGVIRGASATNTITFDGGAGNASTRIVTFAGNASNPHTFRMNGSQYINVRNLTIRSTDGTNGWPVNIIDGQNISVSNCNIEVAGAGANATGGNLGAVVLNASTTSISTGSGVNNNIYIDSNNIKGGYYGIQSYGNTNSTTYNNILYMSYNKIDSSYQYGIQFYFNTVKILWNDITMRFNGSASSAGVYTQQQTNSSYPVFCDISNNKIFNCGRYGMQLQNFYNPYGSPIPYHRIANNMIGKFKPSTAATQTFGIHLNSSYYVAVYHNTVNVDNATTGGNRALYFSQISSSDSVVNNNFCIGNAAATNSIPCEFTSTTTVVNANNNYFNANATNLNLLRIGATNFQLASMNTNWPSGGATGGVGSKNLNPQFPSATDLHLGAAVAAATFNSTWRVSASPYDIDNTPRIPSLGTTTPDMGADEKTTSNIGVSAVVSPTVVTAGSTYSITVRIRNYGTDAVSGFPVKYNLNGGTTVTETYVPTLNGNDSVNFTFATTATFAGCNTLKTWTALGTESYIANDSTNVNVGGNLTGTYTIKPGGGGNFTTIGQAVTFLQCGVVSGPITFLVDPGFTYTEQISIPNIPGVSATNTVTFDAGNGNAASTILTFTPGTLASATQHVLRFNNCNYFTFRNMTIRAASSAQAWTVHFMNGTNNKINNCIVDMVGTGTTSTSTNFAGIVINGSNTVLGTVSTIANNHRVDSSTINYGYYGLYSNINNGNLTNYFTYNNFNQAYQYATFFQNAQTVKLTNNILNKRSSNTTAYGLYMSSVNPAGLNFNEVRNNSVISTGQYGMIIQSTQGGPAVQGQLYNNIVNGMTYNNSTYGIYMNSASNWNIYHNTVNHDIASIGGPNYGMFVQNGSNNDVQNNILSTTIPTAVAFTPLNIAPTSAASNVNANNYWNPSSTNLVNMNGINLLAGNFKAGFPIGAGVNSLNNNPGYVSGFNLHITNPCNNGLNLGITSDFEGNSRGSAPDMGAYEMTSVPNNDMGVSVINSPSFPLSPGVQSINVTLKNFGGNTITSADINYTVNGGAVTTQAWTGSLAPCDTISLTLTTPFNFINGSNNLKVFTTSPNGFTDVTPSNDTAQFTLCPAMAGVYTIGGGGNYATFNAAVGALVCGGMSGPITFNVASGTYTETVDIPAINGSSAVNTITFNGGSSATTILTSAATNAGAPALLRLNNCSYVTFKNITLRTTDAINGWAAHFYNGLNNRINNCVLDIAGAGATATGANLFGVVINGNYTSFSGTNSIGDGHIIDSCTFNAGYYNLYTMAGATVTYNFLYNTLNNAYSAGAYFNNSHTIKFNNNAINLRNTISSNIGLIFWNCNAPGTHEVRNNKFNNVGQYGVQFQTSGGGVGSGQCYNNFFGGFRNSGASYGIYNGSSSNWKIWNNTINIENNNTSGVAACIYLSSGSGFDIKNNNLTITSTSSAGASPLWFSSTSCASAVDYNNYFNASSTTLATIPTVLTAATYKAAYSTGVGANSMNIAPSYVNNVTNLHITNPCNKGTNLGITTDIDGEARPTTPDIGADEIPSFSRDAMVTAVRTPATAVVIPGSPYSIKITVKNVGQSPITTLDANYSVNGVTTSQTFTGLNIAVCDTLQLTFTTPYSFSGGNNVFRAFTGDVNTLADLNNINDTFTTNFCTPFTGVINIDKTQPVSPTNFISVQSAVNAVYSCGIAGPVVLTIASGSGPYNEQVTFIGVVPGSSAINNIRLSGNTTQEVITFNPTSSGFQHTIRLQAARHIILDRLTINNTGTSFGIGVHITGTSDSNFVQNSNVNISLVNTGFSNSAGIAISSNTASATGTGNNGNKNTINNNAINGGFYGITAVGTAAATQCRGNELTNNILNGQAQYGIYHYYQKMTNVNGNTVDNMLATSTGSYGMSFLNVDTFEINKNKINRFGQYGMYFQGVNYQNATGTYTSFIVNNMIGGLAYNANPNGMYFSVGAGTSSYKYVNVWHNTVHLVNQGGGYAHYFSSGASPNAFSLDYRNNTFTSNNNSGYMAYFNSSGVSPFINFLNNNITSISNPTGSTTVFGGSGYSGTSWMPSASGPVTTSSCFAVDPQFINYSTNLHTISPPLSNIGTNIPGVTSDIDGDSRPLSPSAFVDIGADEFNIPAENIGAFAVINPTFPLTPGLQNVVVQIKNFGAATITSANVSYKVGVNGTIKTQAWTGSIATNATANVTFTGANQYNFTGTVDTIIAWTDGPNGLPDGFLLNDTTSNIVCQPLNGVYTMDTTIAPSATNFVNFSSIAYKLNTCGVTGPVTINIANGTYAEQFVLNQFQGSSATNTVTFQSATANPANVTIQYNGGSSLANNYVVKMNGTDYTIWKDLTLLTTNTSFGNLVWWLNNPLYNTYQNVVFTGPTVFTTSQNSALVFANNGALVTPGQGDDNNTFNACTFNNGSFGLFLNSTYGSVYTRGTTVTGCTFNNQYYEGAYLYFHLNVNFSRNIITTNSTYTNYYGLYMYNGGVQNTAPVRITRNKVTTTTANGYGMSLQYIVGNGGVGDDIQIMNNMISIGSGSGSACRGFDLSYTKGKIYHNTVNITSGNANGYAFYMSNNTAYSPISDIRYNIFANSGNGASAGFCIYSTNNAIGNMLLDSNVYFQGPGASNFGSFNGTPYLTKAAWTTGMGSNYDLNSIVTNPNFVSPTDLHISTSTNIRSVPRQPFVTEDIDGPRCGVLTETGADFHPANNDIGVSSISNPLNGVASPGLTTISVYLRNYGNNAVTSANVTYDINGTVVTEPWTGTLNTCDSVIFTFAAQYNFGLSAFTIKAFTSLPNGSADAVIANDSTVINGCIGVIGTYTIGGTPGPTNYVSFAAAINAMTSCGITGPVVFNVAATTFNEQIVIPYISGVSAVNTITFNGAGPTTVLNFNTTSAAFPYVLRFNNAQHVYFRNMTINATDVINAWNVNFLNSKRCGVSNCVISNANYSSSSNSNVFGVLLNGSTTNSNTASTLNDSLYIDSNQISTGYHNLSSQHSDGSKTIYIRGNVFTQAPYSCLYIIGNQTMKILGNTLTARLTPTIIAYNLYLQSSTPTGSNFHEIGNNIIRESYQAGIFINSANGTATASGLIYNNMVSNFYYASSSNYGIFTASCNYWKIYHNTVNYALGGNANTSYCYYNSNGTNMDVRNNIFAVTNPLSTNCIPFYTTANNSFLSGNVDYNNYYNAAGTTLVNLAGTLFTASNYRNAFTNPTGGGGGANSYNYNPLFVSATNLHHSLTCNNGANLGITTDIDNQSRSTSPDIGADEVPSNANDVGATAFITPVYPITVSSNYSIKGIFRNFGSNPHDTLDVYYSVNGATPVAEQIVLGTALNSCDTVSYTFATQFTAAAVNSIRMWAVPTVWTDVNNTNDTAYLNICGSLSGLYTIGGAPGPTNFPTFAAAISQLTCGGVSGAVTFDVTSATYNESIIIPAILGTNPSATITFRSASGNPADVTLAGIAPFGYGVRLSGTKNIIFSAMTLTNNNAANGVIVELTGGCDSNQFYNCVFNAINISNANCLISNSSSRDRYNIIRKNVFNSGFNGVFLNHIAGVNSGRNNTIDSNTFNNQYQVGLLINNNDSVYVRNNVFTTNTSLTTASAINTTTIGTRSEIVNNKISGLQGLTGIILSNVNGSAANPVLVANNFIQVGAGTNLSNGISTYGTYCNIYNNSINITSGNTLNTAGALYFNSSTATNMNIKNNIFYNSGNGVTAGYAVSMVAGMNFTGTLFEYNNYFSRGTNIAYWSPTTSNYATLAAWKTGVPAQNPGTTSRNLDVTFVSPSDLHHTTPCLADLGLPLTAVPADIDGTTRSVTSPDMGADEYNTLAFDAGMMSIISPNITAVTPGSPYTLTYKVKNFGSTAITSLDAGYFINNAGLTIETGLTPSPGTMNACDTGWLTFSATISFPAGISYLKSFTSLINGANSDLNNANDTLIRTYCTPLSGSYTVDSTLPSSATNFNSITQAISTLYTCGVAGPVLINIKDDVYNEPMLFNGMISGSSPINTITFQPDTTSTAVTITSASAITLNLNGAKYVTFDGRAGGLGSTPIMTIENTNTGSATVQYINDAIANTLRYDIIKGSNANLGTIVFSTTTGTFGNDTNVIDNCTIRESASGTSRYGIYSAGTAAKENGQITISNNQIINFYNSFSGGDGINLASNSTFWNIVNNKITQTAVRIPAAVSLSMHGIYCVSGGEGHNIIGNVIGGNIPSIPGSIFQHGDATLPLGYTPSIFAIRTNTLATANYVNMYSNVITNLKVFVNQNSAAISSTLLGILINGGNANIGGVGTASGNIIGDDGFTPNNSLQIVSLTNLGVPRLAGIRILGGTNLNVRNNKVNSMSINGTSASVAQAVIAGIDMQSGIAFTSMNFDSNIIGSLTTPHSITALPTSLHPTQVAGFFVNSNTSGTLRISNNIISNLSNQITTPNNSNNVRGMAILGNLGAAIDSNIIMNLFNANDQSAYTDSSAVVGIYYNSSSANKRIFSNIIRNLATSSTSAKSSVLGMYVNSTPVSMLVRANAITGLTSASTNTGAAAPYIRGIFAGLTGVGTYYNNQISLGTTQGGDALIYGICDSVLSPSSIGVIHNSVYIGGISTGSNNSYAFYRMATSDPNIKNNIFYNERTGSGNQYAMGVTSLTNWTSTKSNNNYLVTASSSIVADYLGSPQDFATWITTTDAASSNSTVSGNPALAFFVNAALGDLHIKNNACEIKNRGAVSVVSDDIDLTTRDASPDLGSDELGPKFDVAAVSLISPQTGFGKTSTEVVTFRIRNASLTDSIFAGTTIPVNYKVNALTTVTENFTLAGALAPGDSANYTFTATFDMSTLGAYSIRTFTAYGLCDDNRLNDTITTVVYHGDSIRNVVGDYIIASGCVNISGTNWINVSDSFGSLVFAINPEGNNIGPTCWKVRISNPTDSMRKDSIINTVDGLNYYSIFLGRNLVITPTTQPTTRVSIRIYMKDAELQRLYDTASDKFGATMLAQNIKIHKFHLNAGNEGLTPLTAAGVNDSSTFLQASGIAAFGSDKYVQFRTPGFSQFNVVIPNANPLILPVTWLSFDAKANGNDANLNWATASERNSKDFDIERSLDGKEFTSVGKVKAAGNSSMIQTYSFIDKDAANLNADKVYYRLKQNDLDGQFDYSKIRVVQFKGKDGIIVHSVSPNPFNTNVSADFTLLAEDQVSLILTNISGQVVKVKQMQGQKGDNNYRMNTEEFAAGVYFLKIQTKDNQFIYKLIKN